MIFRMHVGQRGAKENTLPSPHKPDMQRPSLSLSIPGNECARMARFSGEQIARKQEKTMLTPTAQRWSCGMRYWIVASFVVLGLIELASTPAFAQQVVQTYSTGAPSDPYNAPTRETIACSGLTARPRQSSQSQGPELRDMPGTAAAQHRLS